MPIKLSLADIYRSYTIVQVLLNQPLDIKVTIALRKWVLELQPHFERIRDIQDRLLIEKNFELNPDGSYSVTPEQHIEFSEDLFNQLSDTVEIDCEPISVYSLSNVQLSIKDLEGAHFLFNDL